MKQPFIREMVRDSVAGLVNHPGGGGAAGLIANLFAAGQQGFWLPFTDFASLTQDSAGTLPYTALEQPVGRVLDRSGRGNHASQVTSAARGVVSARVNLLQSTNSFSGGGWSSGAGIVITPADTPSPLGGMADKIEMTAAGSAWRQLLQTVSTVVGTSYSGKFLVKAAAPEDIGKVIAFRHASGGAYLLTTLTADWALVGRDEVCATTTTQFTITHRPSVGTTSGVISFHLAAAELKLSNQSSLPYQRVTTPTDYDAVGFPKYLRLDGTDDFYTCGGGGSTTGFFYSDVVRLNAGGLTQQLVGDRAAGNIGWFVEITTTNRIQVNVSKWVGYDVLQRITPLSVGAMTIIQAWMDEINVYLQVDGEIISMPKPAGFVPGSATMAIGGIPHLSGSIVEPIYRAGPPPSAYERGVIRGYQMQKAGML